MIEDTDPKLLEGLSLYQIMQKCFGAEDWRRVFQGVSRKAWRHAYEEYLTSDAWRRKREARLNLDGYRCSSFLCFLSHDLQVHHKTYSSVGDEDVENDLITLCNRCHEISHGLQPPREVDVLKKFLEARWVEAV